ncbi:hypothetical protein RV134_380009 [Roseovarius sp. EC-HK134]|nr:hypothetical protein RV134_380009 [Roseovarius sp. EC-HK134]
MLSDAACKSVNGSSFFGLKTLASKYVILEISFFLKICIQIPFAPSGFEIEHPIGLRSVPPLRRGEDG